MHFPVSSLLTIAATSLPLFFLLATASPTPAEEELASSNTTTAATVIIFDDGTSSSTVHVTDEERHNETTSLFLDKRVENNCHGAGHWLNRHDANNLANDLQNNNPGQMHAVNNRRSISYELGTAKVCIENYYWYDNTHVSRWEIGWVIRYMLETCPSCSPARFSDW